VKSPCQEPKKNREYAPDYSPAGPVREERPDLILHRYNAFLFWVYYHFNTCFFFDYTKEIYLLTLREASALPSSPPLRRPHNATEPDILI
jgi:hypothetical protein